MASAESDPATVDEQSTDSIDQLDAGLEQAPTFYEEPTSLVPAPVTSDDECDTDLDCESTPPAYDHSGRTFYVQQCKIHGVIPAGYYVRHMLDSKLEMKHHGLGLAGIRPICASLCGNGTITRLDLTDNWLGNESVPYLAEMLKENTFVSELVLAANRLGVSSVGILCDALANNTQLTHVDLSRNNYADNSAPYFADLIVTSMRLSYLNLSHNDFADESVTIFGKALPRCTSLIELNLSWNHIRGKGLKVFATGLGKNSCLKQLNLGWNGIGPSVGCQELARGLKSNSTLEELDLTNNRISTEGAVLLGKGLTANKKLRVLKIGRNPMQTAGCYAIVNAIMLNEGSALRQLCFQDILVNQDFRDLMQTAAERFPDLVIETGTLTPERCPSGADLVARLKNLAESKGLNVQNYLGAFDDDHDFRITCQEFRLAVEQMARDGGLPVTEEDINRLVRALDKSRSGRVTILDFCALSPSATPTQMNGMEDKQVETIAN